MNNEALNKIIRKKVIWAEIKSRQREYQRLQKQIDELEQAKKDLSFEVQQRLAEIEKIGEWMAERECEALMRADEKQTDV